jgi:hypothetical protein
MAVIAGTITGVNVAYSRAARKTYEVCVDFPAYTGASDTFSIAGVGAAIAAKNRNGKTHTLLQAMCVGCGYDTAAQAVFTGACTVSTDALTGNLTTSDGSTEITTSTAAKGVRLFVTVTES